MTTPLVEARNLSRTFGAVRAVDDVSFSIPRGATLGLVGESGSGKTTTAAMLLALERPTSGTVLFDGADLFAMRAGELRRKRADMQIVMQDPVGALNRRKTVEQIVGLPLATHASLSRAARTQRVGELLDRVGLPASYRDRYPHELSGGQCQRVGIARAIALDPAFVVLDEPVSAVDVAIQAQILNLLRELQRSLGLTYLFVSHDLAVVRYMAPTVAVMYQGKIVEYGSREEIFTAPAHDYTRRLLAAVPQPDPGRRVRGEVAL